MDQNDRAILQYLQKKGYRQAEEMMKEDSVKVNTPEQAAFDIHCEQDVQLNNYLVSNSPQHQGVTSVHAYESQFSRLKKWIHNSLDVYKRELLSLLYPVFVHCFLDLVSKEQKDLARQFIEKHKPDFLAEYKEDIEKLSMIFDQIHLKENSLAIAFRHNKYNLKMSSYSFELLILFLNENKLTLLRKLVNQYLNIVVFDGSSMSRDENLRATEGLGSSPSQSALSKVYWGSLPPHPKSEEEIWKQFKTYLSHSVKQENIASIVSVMKKLRPDSINKDESPARERVPLPDPDMTVELSYMKELSKKVNITKQHRPSACCYTFHNAYDSLNSLDFSPDFHYIAGGFSDSYIEIWNLKKEKLKSIKRSMDLALMDMDSVSDLADIMVDDQAFSKKLIGHSGPVYGCSFSHDQRFLLSCSQDSTARLWSLDTFSNIVSYQGHEGPVWDVSMGPQGLYFLTGSSDRTARLWSTEYIIPLRIFIGHLSDVESVGFHPNSNYIVTGSADKTVRLWDIQGGNCVRLFNGHRAPIMSVTISNDGKYIASGDTHGHINLWDIAAGKLISSLHDRHTRAISSLTFNYESTVLGSGSLDGSVCVWDMKEETSKITRTQVKASESSTPCPLPAGMPSETVDSCISSFKTKQTPVFDVHFTLRNLMLIAGPYSPNLIHS